MASIDPARETKTVQSMLFAIPVIGWVAKDLLHGAADNIYYLIAAVLSLWAVAVMTWGLPALAMGALGMVPVMFVILIMITLGK